MVLVGLCVLPVLTGIIGNLLGQVFLSYFVWGKSGFSSPWLHLMLTKPGAVCGVFLLCHLLRVPLLSIAESQVEDLTLGHSRSLYYATSHFSKSS